MSKCNRCNIKVKDDSLICPLCKGALSETEHVQPGLSGHVPEAAADASRNPHRAFCVVVGVVVLGIVNYMTYHGVRWSLVSLAGIAYLYFTFTFTAQPLADEQQKIIFQGVISAALVLAVDFSLGYAGWSVNIGIPVDVIATNITIFVFMMVRRRDWRSYIMPQLELTLIAAVELLLVSLEVVTWKLLTLVAVFTVLVQLFGIFVIGGRSTTLELNRRFRV